jgi:hypothetical protein
MPSQEPPAHQPMISVRAALAHPQRVRGSSRRWPRLGASRVPAHRNPQTAAVSRWETDTAGQTAERPLTAFPQFRGRTAWVRQVMDSNLRRLSRQIYRPLSTGP